MDVACKLHDKSTPSNSSRPKEGKQGSPVEAFLSPPRFCGFDLLWRVKMKWAGMYLVGFLVLIGGVLAALWKLGILASIGATWTAIGVAIAVGIGIMVAVSNSGTKENIEINRK